MGYPTDTQETYDTYNGRPCITLCDNYYNNTITRAPGLMRYGYFHSFNNYVVNFDMGYTIYSACKLYSESNYFEAGTGKGSPVSFSLIIRAEYSPSIVNSSLPSHLIPIALISVSRKTAV